jgi:hypothetical protein
MKYNSYICWMSDKVIYSSIETMFNAVNTCISSGRFMQTFEMLDIIEDFLNEINPKLNLERTNMVNDKIKISINYIRHQNDYIPIEINNRLDDFQKG